MNWKDDMQRDETTVAKVEVESAGGWSVTRDDGWSLWVTSDQCSAAPSPGETMLCFGEGIGRPVRGIVIGGRVYRYETAEQHEERARMERLERARKMHGAAVAERAERDARIAKLPEPFQRRIRRFLAVRDKWAAEFERYELFVCEDAAEIARVLGNAEAIDAFYRASLAEQHRLAPGVRLDEHSGNTLGAACHLAIVHVQNPELVAHAHGALCPLVGCVEYGCFAAVEGKQEPQP